MVTLVSRHGDEAVDDVRHDHELEGVEDVNAHDAAQLAHGEQAPFPGLSFNLDAHPPERTASEA